MRPSLLAASLLLLPALLAEEARYGFEVPASVSVFGAHTRRGQPARGGSNVRPAFRGVIYPALKLGNHWFAYGAVQVHSQPYFYEELASGTRSINAAVLQAYVGYSRMAEGKGFTIKVGQLTSAFGTFPLRYDDARNWVIDLPQSYGYYYFPVTVYGLPGAELDAAIGGADFRVQFTNSSTASPRSLRQHGQYGAVTAGGGYRLSPGLRLGASATRGAYLYRGHSFFFPGEAHPKAVPMLGYGLDMQWARGKWNVNAEAQRFQFPYRAVPYFFNSLAYGEVKYTINPRWYVSGRAGTRWRTFNLGHDEAYELVIAYRPAKGHLIKAGYLALDGIQSPGTRDNVLGAQYVVSLRPPAVSWD